MGARRPSRFRTLQRSFCRGPECGPNQRIWQWRIEIGRYTPCASKSACSSSIQRPMRAFDSSVVSRPLVPVRLSRGGSNRASWRSNSCLMPNHSAISSRICPINRFLGSRPSWEDTCKATRRLCRPISRHTRGKFLLRLLYGGTILGRFESSLRSWMQFRREGPQVDLDPPPAPVAMHVHLVAVTGQRAEGG
jgi:hypothetical protein